MLFTMKYYFLVFAMSKSKINRTIVDGDGRDIVDVTTSSTITGGTPVNNLEKAATAATDKLATGMLGKFSNSLAGKVLIETGKEYKKNAYDAKAFYNKVKNIGNDFTKNVDTLGGRVLTGILTNSGFLGDPSEIVDGLLGASKGKPLSDMIKFQQDQIKVAVNGIDNVIKDIKDFDVESVGSIVAMINGIVDDGRLAEALDLGAEFAMLKELNVSSLLLGIAGSVDIIIEYKKDKKERRLLLLDGLPTAVRMSNIDYVNKCIDHSGIGAVWSRCPTIITDLLTSYKLPDGQSQPSEYSTKVFIDLLDRLKNRWEYTSSQYGTERLNLDVFNRLSQDANWSLGLNERFKDAIGISGSYVPQVANAAFKTAYPYY